jgi:hypothetical protein
VQAIGPVKQVRSFACGLTLITCGATVEPPLAPSQKTIASIESGYALLEDLARVGVADAATMNAASRVKVRNVRCNLEAGDVAVCSYEASRCLNVEADVDGDGWCARTTSFARISQARGIGDVMVGGWALDAPIRSDLLADPAVAELIRLRSIACLDSSSECVAKQTQIADSLAARDLTFVEIATGKGGTEYSLLQRDLRSRAGAKPRVWVFRDDRNSATSSLWQIDCESRTHVELAEVLRDRRGTFYRWGSQAARVTDPGAPADELVAAVCKAPVISGYSHL